MTLANVDISNSLESCNQWIWALEALAGWQLWIGTGAFEIVEIGVEEGVDSSSGIEDSMLLNLVSIFGGEGGGDFFYRSMLCKWTKS